MSNLDLLTPENSTMIFIDHQPQMAFGVTSIDRQLLKNNVIALAKSAKVFKVPTILTTVETKSFSGNMWPELLAVFPGHGYSQRPAPVMGSCPLTVSSLTIRICSTPATLARRGEEKLIWRVPASQTVSPVSLSYAARDAMRPPLLPPAGMITRSPTTRGELERPDRYMSFNEFKQLIDDIGRYLLLAVLWSWGEPFMNRQLPQIIKYATDNGIQTVTSTNCHFLEDDDFVAEVMNSGLSSLIVAVDSTSVHSYSEYRREGNVHSIVKGVKNLVRIKRKTGAKTRINLRMVAMRQNELEIKQTFSFARELGADIFSVKTANPSSGATCLDSQIVPNNPKLRRYAYHPGTFDRVCSTRPCRRIWTITNVHSNGDVVPCCRDFTGDMQLGNIFKEPLSKIWMSDRYSELRKNILTMKHNNSCILLG